MKHVQIAKREELLATAQKEIQETGFTLNELWRQAANNRFETEKARRAWFVVAPLVPDLLVATSPEQHEMSKGQPAE